MQPRPTWARRCTSRCEPDTEIMPVRAFGTFTQDLHNLAVWFHSCGVTSVAMESTDVYWIPAFEILEAHGSEVILVNARYAKNVPGRKTDESDAAWLRQLHSYGLAHVGASAPKLRWPLCAPMFANGNGSLSMPLPISSTCETGTDGDEPPTASCRL
ncbi:transposase [Sagittula sp. NFXS13]|uniref:IS110 family transposase n=1 Tax=Sagittula sp. NFXS13 TaxID=2819095 RepID=UPI0032DF9556